MSDDEVREELRDALEPLRLRDDGKAGCGMRMSHRDGESYLEWSREIMYGPASANLDMN